ncbi:MCE family protein [Desulfovibrio oxamicus]|uniref:MCE family protein n=1 Tax=Nitratidesulfovibrio oxamicus TaxID=32016 RepID=A0ABS0J0N5_9BACT|nr:MlaD family protein [Nitratidesulfovibrio oxamicus]MBG3875959.1 MCE family protein [Nitratidesulfovibrio oxamicus]
MAREANKAMLGAFVMGALALLAAAVLLFGSGRFMKDRPQLVLYFKGSVRGLNIGAPVVFRGVPIGSVTEIRLLHDPNTLEFFIPVFIEFEPERVLNMKDGTAAQRQADGKMLDLLVEKGLRARLTLQSFVTGQLMIELDFEPGSPLVLRGDGALREIPTLPSPMEELTRTLQNLPIDNIMAQLNEAVAGLNKMINSPVVADTAANLNDTLKDVRQLVASVNGQVGPVGQSLAGAAQRYGALADKLDRQLPDALAQTTQTLKSLAAASTRAEAALAAAHSTIRDDSRTMTEVQQALREMGAAARSLRALAEYLERHPEALLRGKGDYR